MSSLFRYRKDHPLRIPSWRWERSRILKEYGEGAPGKGSDDKWTLRAAKFRQAKDACKDEISAYEVYDRYPDLATAYEMWDEDAISSGNRVNALRYEIEARILAREPLDSIAAKSGISKAALNWYEKLFFNVTDRLNNKPYIFHQVIGDTIHRGMTDRDYAVLWKLYGYVRGPAVLDYLISTFIDWSRPAANTVESSLQDDHRSTMRRKTALASRMYGINTFSTDKLIELQTRIVEIEKNAGATSTDSMHANIQAMLTCLPLLVGRQVAKVDNVNKMAVHYGMAADLRADEMLALSAEQPVDFAKLGEYKFPEPVNDAQDTK